MRKNREIKLIFTLLAVFFAGFLAVPMISVLVKSFTGDGTAVSLSHYAEVLTGRGFLRALGNSLLISVCSALITTVLAFILAYTIHYTNLGKRYKWLISKAAILPMLLPTITYGFAIIYSFGKQGLLTQLFGRQLFDIYGFNGLLLGYVVYTLPIAFTLINNAMGYIDKRFMIVSRLMGDSPLQTFRMTIVIPLLGTLAAAFIQTFFLCFTDFGIPASVGGQFEVVASVLYTEMLGSVPNFGNGAVVALVMIIPSVVSITVLHILEKYNVRYNKISPIELKKGIKRDTVFGILSGAILVCSLCMFLVMFVVPFIEEWPYRMNFTMEHVQAVFEDPQLSGVYVNSLMVAVLTALLGTLLSYGGALVTARSTVSGKVKKVIDSIALVTNTIPGMVIGLAYLFVFTGTPLQNTFPIIIICNIVHFFSTPYLMMKNSLSKMNASWETTAMLMGDNWIKTITRVVTPNALSTLLEVFSYYFVNAMVTVSAVIFIAGARTMVITTKIKELQYFNEFNEIFVLSLLILITNLIARALFQKLAQMSKRKENIVDMKKVRKMSLKRVAAFTMAAAVAVTSFGLTGCGTGSSDEQVIIYSNADEEAITAMENALDNNGYEGKYMFQTFGTSELGGKLLAEGKDIEADMVTMSTFYIESAQDQNSMFQDLTFDADTIDEFEPYCAPITSQEGTIIVNTEMMEENDLPMPASLKDLADPVYKGFISVTDISASSTAWLLIQALVSEYGEEGAKEVLTGIYENVGDHLEDSGSAPLKKVRAGEVAIGFGLRQQAVADKADGLPIDYIDPAEGNFSLTESVAVVDKGDNTNPLAMEMAQCIIENGREELQSYYPNALYNGESTDAANKSANPKVFPEKLTVDLLEQHQALSEEAKEAAGI
ncbi:extracellular solute-binding protein [[Ruminococcus] torques]|uniref:extracellular solute-binding protein n=1 Tax=[Ruminococcus] torques TaxID=33039 RepID=UPI0025A477F2|nr:extracellular solute-binding protein [[Ruminococcus] torques]MDM8237240.1 extracellular solute-binding protein [[Ruminococcus] torques]